MPIVESITESLDLLIVAPRPNRGRMIARVMRHATPVLETVSATALVEHYRRHAVAPVLVVRTMLPLLQAAGKSRVLLVNNALASLAGKTQGGDYAVCASGAAFNMLARALAHDVAAMNIIVGIGNPDKFADEEDGRIRTHHMSDRSLGCSV
jgi:NAD(P)-dependent dehydrogenase (short-subunit alcohol dehydrogenase family)